MFFFYNFGSTAGILEPTMSDTAQDVDQLTRQTADLSSDSLPRQLSFSSLPCLFGLSTPSKHVIMGLISSVWKFASDIRIEALENSTFIFHFGRCQDKPVFFSLHPGTSKVSILCFSIGPRSLLLMKLTSPLRTFWIQLYGIPMAGMNKSNIRSTRVQVLRD